MKTICNCATGAVEGVERGGGRGIGAAALALALPLVRCSWPRWKTCSGQSQKVQHEVEILLGRYV